MAKYPIICDKCEAENEIEVPEEIVCKDCSNQIRITSIFKKISFVGATTLVAIGALGTAYVDDIIDDRYPIKVEYKMIRDCIGKGYVNGETRDICICAIKNICQKYSKDNIKEMGEYKYISIIKDECNKCSN